LNVVVPTFADDVDLPVGAEEISAVLAEAKRRGAHWAEVYVERRDSETVRLEDRGITSIRTDRDMGAGVRVVHGEREGFAYTNVLSLESLLEAAQAAAVGSGGGDTCTAAHGIDLRARRVEPVQHADVAPSQTGPDQKAALLRRIDDSARSRGREVVQVTVIHVDIGQDVLIADSSGSWVRDRRVRTRVTCRASASRDGRMQSGFEGPGTGGGMELYDTHSPERIGGKAADRALRALDGVQPPRGVLPVVLGSAGGGLLLHEACGHGLEADGLSRATSIYSSTFDTQVASPLLTAVDDPALALAYGSYAVDDEGTDSEPTVLLRAGVQVGAITNAATARRLGRAGSANARRESYAHPPLSRMSNTYVAAGDADADAIVADVRRGVYVARLKGGDVNIATGDFAFAASEAFLIESGEVTRPLDGVMLLGNGPAALGSIDAVGSDLDFTQALCGKEEQWVPVSYGSPTLRLTGLTVSGGGSD
jgi:TldD protein